MKNSQTVYKVVQVVGGKMYSVNPPSSAVYLKNHKMIIQYNLFSLSLPSKKQNPYLFLLPTRKDARIAKKFYGGVGKKIKILRGTATQVTSIKPKIGLYVHADFRTIFGDTFFPIEVVY